MEFRYWDIKYKKFLDKQIGYIDSDCFAVFKEGHFSCFLDSESLIPSRSTGLKDRYGKDIFEGDIIKAVNGSINGRGWEDKPFEVKYVLNKGFVLHLFMWYEDGEINMDNTHYCEVIGNKFENPELLL